MRVFVFFLNLKNSIFFLIEILKIINQVSRLKKIPTLKFYKTLLPKSNCIIHSFESEKAMIAKKSNLTFKAPQNRVKSFLSNHLQKKN